MEATATTEIFLKMIEEPSPEPVPTPTPFSPGGVINGVQTGDPFSIFVFIMSLLIVLTLICFFIWTFKKIKQNNHKTQYVGKHIRAAC